MPPALRRHAPFLLVLLLALFLRAWHLEAVPNPCADEGNWTWIPFDLVLGRPSNLPPEARFVPMTFAHLVRLSFQLFGPSFAAARGVLGAGFLLGLGGTYALLCALRLPRAALLATLALALHPWGVFWARSVSVPYALGLACASVGTLGVLASLRAERAGAQLLGLLLSGQVLFLGLHFSPLQFLPIGACGLWVLLYERRALARPWLWLSLGASSVHAWMVLRGIFSVAAAGATRPNHQFTNLASRLHVYARTVLGSFVGEAQVRHFTGHHAPLPLELLLLFAALVPLLFAMRLARTAPEAALPGVRLTPRELARFGLLWLAVGLVGMPVLLAPARPWQLPAIDADRYLFILLVPFAFLLGALAEGGLRRERVAAWLFALYLFVPTARIGGSFLWGGGQDRGIYTLQGGGGYRGWRTPRELRPAATLLREEALRVAAGEPATILVTDYAFHPLHFVNAERGFPTVDVFKFPAPDRPGGRFFFVLWSEGLFAPGYHPRRDVDWSNTLRARMHAQFEQVSLVRRFVQPDGTPLFELWTGRQPSRATH